MQAHVPLALTTLLALIAPALAQTPATAGVPRLAAVNIEAGATLAPAASLEFTLAAPLATAAGQLTLMVNGNDVGSFLQTADAVHFVLDPAQFPLPAGQQSLELVFEPAGGGEPLVLARLQVVMATIDGVAPMADDRLPADATALAGATGEGSTPAGGQVGSAPPPAGWVPKGQLQASATSNAREVNGVASSTVTRELALQLGLRYEGERDGMRLALGSNFVGNSQLAKAVRFGTAGPAAQKIDLNDYLAEFQTANARLSLGTSSVSGHPLLGQSMDNRGVAGVYRFASGVDVAVTSQSANALVGASPFTGVMQAQRRLTAATVGVELAPEAPGTLRVEATGLTARSEPRNPGTPAGPGQGAAAASESSHGLGLRLVWAPAASIYKLDSAYARSTSVQQDPFGGEQRTSGRQAYYLDGSARVIDRAPDAGVGARRLVLRVRHEFADTGFRSVAGGASGDLRRTLVGAEGQWGVLQAQAQHSVARNNVAGLAALPVVETTANNINLTLPLAALLDGPPPTPPAADAPPVVARSWWPTLQAGWQHNSQAPVRLPAALAPELVPALASNNATLNAQWVLAPWTWSVGLTRGFKDNRQPGFDTQDQRARGRQLQLQWQASPTLAVTAGLRHAVATATDTGVSQSQRGTDLGLSWQPGSWSLSAQYGQQGDRDSIGAQDSRGHNWQLQATRSFALPWGPGKPTPMQLGLRLQRQEDRSNTTLLGTSTLNTQSSRLVGLTLTATL